VTTNQVPVPSREQLIHHLYEAAELEHTLMCTYLYAAFSLRQGEAEGLTPGEATAVAGWRQSVIDVAIEEMGHLAGVWNITSALGGAPRFGRGNFPLDPGALPAAIVVKLAPFGEAVLQHFIHLERPIGSPEPEGDGFAPELVFTRAVEAPRITPMAMDYDTVGEFYASLGDRLRAFVAHHGESVAFCGDPDLQLSPAEVDLRGAEKVVCLKTALAVFTSIIEQGEGAPAQSSGSHFQKFAAIRVELGALKAARPDFSPAFPSAHNPVLRPPLRREGRVWIEDPEAAATVDLANTGYQLMLRLLAFSYGVPRPGPDKSLAVDLAIALMRAVTVLGEHAARLPAGPSHPACHAGMSFTALRDAAAFPPGTSSHRFFRERLGEMAAAAAALQAMAARRPGGEARPARAARLLGELAARAERDLAEVGAVGREIRGTTGAETRPESKAAGPEAAGPAARSAVAAPAAGAPAAAPAMASGAPDAIGAPPIPTVVDGVEHIEGRAMTLLFDGKKCIHSRFCVTGAPQVFLANVKGPWIAPDAIEVEGLVEIAHACPSGAIAYRRKDGRPDEVAPPVNLLAIREAGPYAVRGALRIAGQDGFFRATLCRCGASKNKPYCDGSHHEIGFSASGEPATTTRVDMLPVRDGPLAIEPIADGPLSVRGNLEITSGTGRVVARVVQATLCRCGASNSKPFCDGSHARVGFTG
jgi:CDGSH-type Zn-finger protein/uncharacterized Fe-S cluster protein YjdI